MATTIKILEIVFSVLLVGSILLQQHGSGLGAAFGGTGNVYRSRRGLEKFLFAFSVVMAVLFVLSAAASVFWLKPA